MVSKRSWATIAGVCGTAAGWVGSKAWPRSAGIQPNSAMAKLPSPLLNCTWVPRGIVRVARHAVEHGALGIERLVVRHPFGAQAEARGVEDRRPARQRQFGRARRRAAVRSTPAESSTENSESIG